MIRSAQSYARIALVSAFAGAALLACSSDKSTARPAQNANGYSPPPATSYLYGTDRESDASVNVSDEIRRECELPSEPIEVPRFDFDEATLRPRGRNILDDVATCLSSGPLEGRAFTIIGRADPRGTDAYNLALGESRAYAARNYLVQRGADPAQVRIVSRGERDARGYDEQSWALDRRVDLTLGEDALGATSSVAGDDSSPPASRASEDHSTGTPATERGAATYADQTEGAAIQR